MARLVVCFARSRQAKPVMTALKLVRALSPERRGQNDAVLLVSDDDQLDAEHPGVGPYLVAQRCGHEHDFDDAVDKELQAVKLTAEPVRPRAWPSRWLTLQSRGGAASPKSASGCEK